MVAEKVQQLEEENITLKARIEELQQLFGINPRMPKNCEYCKNFTQYYFKQGKSYYPTCAGHCVAGSRVKGRRTDDTCQSFARREYGKNFI